MYLPKPWNLTPDVMESEYTIFEQTLEQYEKKVRLCTGLIALLYEELLLLEGNLPEVFPVNNDERAQRFLILFYSSSAFQYSSASFDLAARGRYIESESLMRSLLETVAFVEYFHLKKDECLAFFNSRKGAPDRRRVYKFLRVSGQFPQGGPEKVIARFHDSAHSNINSRIRTWAVKDDSGSFVGFITNRFDSDSLVRITHHLVMPLLGVQQFLYAAFEERLVGSEDLTAKWNMTRQKDLIKQEFPDLWFRSEYREHY